jgi:type I restriction-modification system DNA methylase subunit
MAKKQNRQIQLLNGQNHNTKPAKVVNGIVTLSELEQYLWGAANILRGPVDKADFKSYVFPLLFFKRISDVYDEEYAAALLESGGDEEYAITRNILHVKELLGHRNINSTLVYTHLVPIDDDAESYHHATAKDAKEAGELIEQCWQYVVTTPQGIMLFRKAKKRNE